MESAVTINFENATERFIRLQQAMSPSVRGRIVPLTTRRVFNFIQSHFRAYAQTHHDSADRLGAPHTKHMERAARDMSHTSSESEGRIELKMAGIGRAFHDVDIRMKDRRLTIPLAKESYGKSVADMEKRYGKEAIFFFRSKKGNGILAVRTGGKGRGAKRRTIPLFVLKESVHQKQDATMLPAKEAISDTAYEALKECIDRYIGR